MSIKENSGLFKPHQPLSGGGAESYGRIQSLVKMHLQRGGIVSFFNSLACLLRLLRSQAGLDISSFLPTGVCCHIYKHCHLPTQTCREFRDSHFDICCVPQLLYRELRAKEGPWRAVGNNNNVVYVCSSCGLEVLLNSRQLATLSLVYIDGLEHAEGD